MQVSVETVCTIICCVAAVCEGFRLSCKGLFRRAASAHVHGGIYFCFKHAATSLKVPPWGQSNSVKHSWATWVFAFAKLKGVLSVLGMWSTRLYCKAEKHCLWRSKTCQAMTGRHYLSYWQTLISVTLGVMALIRMFTLSSVHRDGPIECIHRASVWKCHMCLRCDVHLYCYGSVQLHQWVCMIIQMILSACSNNRGQFNLKADRGIFWGRFLSLSHLPPI